MNRRGFTLTELLAVITIIAILAVAAINGYTTMTRNSKKKTYESKVQSIENAASKFAIEKHLEKSETVSVNRLVVEGFLQADESNADGLSYVSNPVTGENMICNLVHITLEENVFKTKYDENNKSCEIALQDLEIDKITAVLKELNGTTIGGQINYNTWTNKDVLITISSSQYDSNAVSISYDFDGNTTTKKKNTPISTATNYVKEDYDKFAVEGVLLVLDSYVTVTYNMADGSTHSRQVVVKIDKEAPTARYVLSNDVTKSSTKKVSLYPDDGKGSGIKGFYVSNSEDFSSSVLIKDTSVTTQFPGDGVFNGIRSYFFGGKATYYVKVIDNVGNSIVVKDIVITNFASEENACEITIKSLTSSKTWDNIDDVWANEKLKLTMESTKPVSDNGLKYIFKNYGTTPVTPQDKLLTEQFWPTPTNSTEIHHLEVKSEQDLMYYFGFMRGLTSNTRDIYACRSRLGLDMTPPSVSLSKNGDTVYAQTPDTTVYIDDELSGFFTSDDKEYTLTYAIVPSSVTTPSSSDWKTVSLNKTAHRLSVTLNDRKDAAGNDLSGQYKIHIRTGSVTDKANNGNVSFVSDEFYLDNTPPRCVNSGGSEHNEWKQTAQTIVGTCSDAHSLCVENTVSKTYTANTELYNISPGVVRDNAGNSTTCDSDRTIKIDLNNPTLTSFSLGSGNKFVTVGSDSGGSGLKSVCISKSSSVSDCSWTPNTNNTYYTGSFIGRSIGTYYAWYQDNAGRVSNRLNASWDPAYQAANASYSDGGYPTLQDAENGVTSGNTIYLRRTFTDTGGVTFNGGKTYYVDLGGYTLNLSSPFAITNGTVYLYNGTYNAPAGNSEFSAEDSNQSKFRSAIKVTGSAAKLYLGTTGGTITVNNTHIANQIYNSNGLLLSSDAYAKMGSSAILNSGVGCSDCGYAAGVLVKDGLFEMVGGTIDVQSHASGGIGTMGVKSEGSPNSTSVQGKISITGGTIKVNMIQHGRCVLCAQDGGRVRMTGGSISITNGRHAESAYGYTFWGKDYDESGQYGYICTTVSPSYPSGANWKWNGSILQKNYKKDTDTEDKWRDVLDKKNAHVYSSGCGNWTGWS